MLKINNTKLKLPLLLAVIGIGGVFLYQYLTFIPEYSSAVSTTITTDNPIELPAINGTISTKFGTAEQGYKTYMQEIDLKYCQSLPEGTFGQLADGRDGKIYWVTVLGSSDKKTCWMTQDLDLDLGPDGPELKTTADGAEPLKGSATTWTSGASVDSSDSGWSTSISDANQIEWWDRSGNMDTSKNNATTTNDTSAMGNLYSYEAATAGTGHAVTGSNAEVPGSICPEGWNLPLAGSDNNLYTSANKLGGFGSIGLTSGTSSTAWPIKAPYYFKYGGYIDGSLDNVGSNGYYWSAVSSSSYSAYRLYFFDSNGLMSTSHLYFRYLGLSVRCVVRDPGYTAPVIPSGPSAILNHPTISVSVQPTLTLTIPTTEVNIDASTGGIATGTFSTIVSSNTSYNLFLSAEQPNLVNPESPKDSIPSINSTIGEEVVGGRSGWGIRYCPEDDTSCLPPTNSTTSTTQDNPASSTTTTTINPTSSHQYTGITKDLTPFYTSNTGTYSKTNLFEVGIGVSPTLPSGSYGTTVTVTASQK